MKRLLQSQLFFNLIVVPIGFACAVGVVWLLVRGIYSLAVYIINDMRSVFS